MNGYELCQAGVIAEPADLVRIALANDGWPTEQAEELLGRYVTGQVTGQRAPKAHWQRWRAEEVVALDKVIAEAGGKMPGHAVTRPLAERLGRSHKAVQSAIDRRIAATGPEA